MDRSGQVQAPDCGVLAGRFDLVVGLIRFALGGKVLAGEATIARAVSVVGASIATVLIAACASTPESAGPKSPSEIIPITAANLRGHESLYREGWFVVSSTEKAFAYAKEYSIVSSGQAIRQMSADITHRTAEIGGGLGGAVEAGAKTGTSVFAGGTAATKAGLSATHGFAQQELDYGNRGMQLAWERFAKGNMTLTERTEQDRAALMAMPGKWYDHLKSDWSNLAELTEQAQGMMSTGIEGGWSEALTEARADFKRAYEKSGTRGNSLAGLEDVLVGYVSALYSGVAKPGARSAAQGGEATVKLAAKAVFLPVSAGFIVTGRTVQSVGMSVYYTTAMGVKLVSPTVEGGLLAGMSMLAYGAVPVTYVAGGAAGGVNQVAVTAAAPVAGAGYAAASATAQTGVYAAQVSFDLAKGVTKVTLNQTQAGIALGYNALTALPTQTVLAAANGAVFLAWDGPRLVIATAKGEVNWRDPGRAQGSVPVQSVPVGTVVDLDALRREAGVTVEVVEDDPEVIQNVLEKLPQDLRLPRTGEKQ